MFLTVASYFADVGHQAVHNETLTSTITLPMDKYDYMILDIIHTYKQEQQSHIRLAVLERNFWKRIEADTDLSVGQARIGERITNLYLDGMLQNKNGYTLTKKGREQLAFAPWKQEEMA
jgi:hypothetical protein